MKLSSNNTTQFLWISRLKWPIKAYCNETTNANVLREKKVIMKSSIKDFVLTVILKQDFIHLMNAVVSKPGQNQHGLRLVGRKYFFLILFRDSGLGFEDWVWFLLLFLTYTFPFFRFLAFWLRSSGGSDGKRLSTMWETWVWSLGREVPWRRKRQPTPVLVPRKSHGRRSLVSVGSWRVGHDWATSLFFSFFFFLNFFNFKIFNSYMRSQTWTPLPPPSP